MTEQNILNEKIAVLAKFQNGTITPLLFKYQDRTVKIESINLRYLSRSGAINIYTFHTSAKGASYKLVYNSQNLAWTLEEISTA